MDQPKNLFDIQNSYTAWASHVMTKERPTRLDLCALDQLIHEAQCVEDQPYKDNVVSVLLFVREQTKLTIEKLAQIQAEVRS